MRARRSAITLALTLSAAPLGAQRVTKEVAPATPAKTTPKPKTTTPPAAPGAVAAASAAAKSVADADVAFAKAAASGGMQPALLATLADDAILFRPRAINGRTWASSATLPGQYTWSPAWAAASADGSLGVTSGPIAYHGTSPDTSATGQYVTVWRRLPTGWKALLQLVVPGPQTTGVTFTPHVPAGDGRPRGGPGAAEGSRATLFIADRGLAAAMRTEATGTAVTRIATSDVRVLRPGALPAIGPDAARSALAADTAGRVVFQTAGDLYMARSGDMGAAYGIYERHNASGAIVEQGNFVRVWERQPDGGWRILVDAATPLSR